ncbi:ABC transporter [Thermocladium modestius]|uniref:ABC transporter n=1 Tax=Thermocladium modestius TaxID=62609 RepID=A0A830GWY2_9CREN|nr:ABC transporter permease [Thermocladium modestius]GGP21484.1 ABC transporter [Thermocladium modestius]
MSRITTQLRGSLVIAWINGWLAMTRMPVWLVSSLTAPASIALMIIFFGGYRYLGIGLVGGISMLIGVNGVGLVGDGAFYRLELKFQNMLIATPLTPVSYTLGLALSSLVYSSPGIAVMLGVLAYMGFITPLDAAPIAAALFAEWLSSSMLGFTISTYLKDTRYAWSIGNIMGFALGTLFPVFYRATVLPIPYLAAFSPVSAASVIIQYASGVSHYAASLVLAAAFSLSLQAALFTLMAMYKSKWRSD